MRDRFGARDERSWKLRFHAQTAGVSLTAQQPYNNVVRTALQDAASVAGLLVTTEAMVAERPEKKAPAGGPGGGMGGMGGMDGMDF